MFANLKSPKLYENLPLKTKMAFGQDISGYIVVWAFYTLVYLLSTQQGAKLSVIFKQLPGSILFTSKWQAG